jgi:hypothetical protein
VSLEVSYINLRVNGMSRHSNVDVSGVARSINGACTCIRAWQNEKLENRVIGVWIKEARLSPWPEGQIGALKRQEAHIYLPPDAFDHAWETALAPTNKQLNLRVPGGSDVGQDVAVVGFSLDELSPDRPVTQSVPSKFSNVISTVMWTLLILLGCYGIARYLKVV